MITHFTRDDVTTRQGVLAALNRIVSKHLEYATEGYAGLVLGPEGAAFDARAAELEGYARMLWGAAFSFNDGLSPANRAALVAGLVNGTDPSHPFYWGAIGNHDQRAVEAAPVAALLLENPSLFPSLNEGQQENLAGWLAGIHSVSMPANNWRFFRILSLKALAACGRETDNAVLASELDFIDDQYRGGGWYGDDPGGTRDYYNGFAFHYYSLLYARWFLDADPERSLRYVDRAREFATRYRRWFDDDGAHVAYGRSLTYRFATAGFWPLLAGFGHDAIAIGEMRGLWQRSLAWWSEQRVFDDEGRMTVGYAYPNFLMSEFYNSPQSPLWSLKAFVPIAFPETHPFWKEDAAAARYSEPVFVDHEGMCITQRRDGGVYLIPAGPSGNEQRNFVDKYCKFAYSSRHGLCVESLAWTARWYVGDNVLGLRANNHWYGREVVRDAVFEGDAVKTVWSPFPGCTVETRQHFTDDGERRTHVVHADNAVEYVATGHAADCFHRGDPALHPSTDRSEPLAVGKTVYSDIRDVTGRGDEGIAATPPNANLMVPRAAVPMLRGELPAGRSVLDTVLTYGKR